MTVLCRFLVFCLFLCVSGELSAQGWDDLFARYRKGATQGNATAQFRLAMLYCSGQGVPQDLAEGAKWLRRAADQGLAEAQFNLGLMYEEGRGVPQVDGEAARWYLRAAEQGYVDAQIFLGVMYQRGHGLPSDPVLAYMWFHIAVKSSNDHPELAILFRDPLFRQLNLSQIAQAQQMAESYFIAHPAAINPGR